MHNKPSVYPAYSKRSTLTTMPQARSLDLRPTWRSKHERVRRPFEGIHLVWIRKPLGGLDNARVRRPLGGLSHAQSRRPLRGHIHTWCSTLLPFRRLIQPLPLCEFRDHRLVVYEHVSKRRAIVGWLRSVGKEEVELILFVTWCCTLLSTALF